MAAAESAHPSASGVQALAEVEIRKALASRLGVEDLRTRRIELPGGASVTVDGATPDCSVVVEIFARQGALKPGQQKKVGLDAFKLVTIGRQHPDAQLVLAFADDAAAQYAQGDSWLAHALRAWKVRVEVVEIALALRTKIRDAQHRQRMVNADDVADDVAVEDRV